MKKPWAGRFTEKTEKSVEEFTCSVTFDARLWKYDIQGSIAHVKMLARQKIISKKDSRAIIRGLGEIAAEIESGKFRFRDDLEDIHMNIEHALIRKIGSAGGRVHTARSRNDQVALDMRLYLRDEIRHISSLIRKLQRALISQAERNSGVMMPGYTHLQRAQPVLLSHHLLAYYEMLDRDHGRLSDCLERVNVMPLGSAALAGTSLPIDRKYVARLLKFPAVSENSIDAVSDRDFVIEFISFASILMMHLSRFAEEMILWNSEEFGFVELPDAFTTGSSIMPQKKNPDILELTRGKTGRVYGSLVCILTLMKGLPLAYNRDMQEDKEALFDAVDTVKASLDILSRMLPRTRFVRKKMENAAEGGFMTATDMAEYLVRKGVPFREAHEITGRIVRECIESGRDPESIDIDELRRFSPRIGPDIKSVLTPGNSINSRRSYGGTAEDLVRRRIAEIRKSLKYRR
jgi:argininosuccinate lyase